jgi:DNA modification methylase
MRLGTAQVIRANSRSLPLADDSVDLVVTSPPYFALRSYQDGGEHYAGQIGDEPTPAEFVASLLEVTRECLRVLKPSGSLWVNLGDKYSGAQQQSSGRESSVSSSEYWKRTNPKTTGVKAKSLYGIPWRYALACIDDLGLILRAEVIWSKPNGLPESVTDRVRRSHEQWFHFTLEPRYFSAVDEIREGYEAEHKVRGREPNSGFPGKDRHNRTLPPRQAPRLRVDHPHRTPPRPRPPRHRPLRRLPHRMAQTHHPWMVTRRWHGS